MLLVSQAFCQNGFVEASDPEALSILETIEADFESQKSHEIDFELTIELPGEPIQKQEGQLIQSGDKFELRLDNQLIISDNETVWFYIEEDNEVQINDAEFGDEGEYMSPNTIFKLYKSELYLFALMNKFSEKGTQYTEIECKPLDEDSEYSKMRLTVIGEGPDVESFKIFAKDGSRFTMTIKQHQKNIPLRSGAFGFDTDDYPGVTVEDLRF